MPDEPKIFFWKYDRPSRGYRGFHLTADDEGCTLLLEILCAKIGSPSHRTAKFALNPLTQKILSVPNCNKPAKTWKMLEILVDHSAAEGSLNVAINNDVAVISVSVDQAAALISGIKDIQAGDGDRAIYDELKKHDEQQIWFWWHLHR